jgi:metal-responsive CopG/Arc/MetJ family transcriptional regulator
MKRINITLSDELAKSVEKLAETKEISVAEIMRRSLEIYLQRFPKTNITGTRIPTYDLGLPLKQDFKKEIYQKRDKEIGD